MKLAIKATPNARKNEILGWENDPIAGRVLKVKIAAPPVEGKANKAIISFLASELGLSKSAVSLEKGETGRIKRFELTGNEDHLRQKLETYSPPGTGPLT